jgi:hypothetical protein
MRPAVVFGAALAVIAGLGATQFNRLQAEAGDYLDLSFSSYWASPVVLVQFAIEQDLAPTEPLLVQGQDDVSLPRGSGGLALNLPPDVGNDGMWQISAEWVELGTDKAWRAQVDLPLDAITVNNGGHRVQLIFGPNGELLIGSDTIGTAQSDKIDLARVCGLRVPAADRAWRDAVDQFPELPDLLAYTKLAPQTTPYCAPGAD